MRRDVPDLSVMGSNETCPVCHTAEIISGKWTLLVIRDLADGCSRFCELERSLGGISPRTLSLQAARPRGRGHRPAAHVPRGAAASRIPPDRQGDGAGAADRPDAPLRPGVAHERPRAHAERRCGHRRAARRADFPSSRLPPRWAPAPKQPDQAAREAAFSLPRGPRHLSVLLANWANLGPQPFMGRHPPAAASGLCKAFRKGENE